MDENKYRKAKLILFALALVLVYLLALDNRYTVIHTRGHYYRFDKWTKRTEFVLRPAIDEYDHYDDALSEH